MKKKIVAFILIILLIVAFVIFHYSRPQTSLPAVEVSKGTIIEQAEAVGYIKPRYTSVVKSQIDGRVAAIYHNEGDFVSKGTPLLRVDPSPSPEVYAAVYQQVLDAKARERKSQIDLLRFQRALASHLIGKNYVEYLQAQQDVDTSKAQRILAEQKLALLEKGNTEVGGKPIANIVSSPIDGYILSRNVDIGDTVISLSAAQSATALYTIANMRDLMFQGVVDEIDVSKIKLEMPATITVGSMPDQQISGKLTNISLQSEKENINKGGSGIMDTNSPFNVGFKVEITGLQLPAGLMLRSGYSATAKIVIKSVKDVLMLPSRVIHFEGDKSYILLPPLGKNQKPRQVPITIGISDGINTEIKSGLKLHDKVLDQLKTPANDED